MSISTAIRRALAEHGIPATLQRPVPAPAVPPEISVRVAPVQFVGTDSTVQAGGEVQQARRRWMFDPASFTEAPFDTGPKPGDRLILNDGGFGTLTAVDAGRARGIIVRYDAEVTGL